MATDKSNIDDSVEQSHDEALRSDATVVKAISVLSDESLIALADNVKNDLTEAALSSPGSEHHQGCFAAAILLSDEMSKRGLRLVTTH